MNILNTINNELDIITTKELSDNSTNILALDSTIKIFMNKFIRNHPNTFAKLIGPQSGGEFHESDSHGLHDIIKIYSDINTHHIKQTVASIDNVSNYLHREIEKKKNILNKDRIILDTDEKINNMTRLINNNIEKSHKYHTFNYTYKDIHNLLSNEILDTVTHHNYLMDSNNFFMKNKLNTLQYLSNYPLINSNTNIYIEKTDIESSGVQMYESAKKEYDKLIDDYAQHVRLVITVNKSGKKKLHRLITKELLQKYNYIASAIKKDIPAIYKKIYLMIDTIINFTASLLDVIGDNTVNTELVDSDRGDTLSMSYGINLINCLESIIDTLIS
jgi:hypothetical protein